MFQFASHISMTLRLSLLFKEVHDRIGSEIHVRLGEPIAFADLPAMSDRHAFMARLREMTYALGEGMAEPPRPKTRKRAPRAPDKRLRGSL
jgi:hypothetical protein